MATKSASGRLQLELAVISKGNISCFLVQGADAQATDSRAGEAVENGATGTRYAALHGRHKAQMDKLGTRER